MANLKREREGESGSWTPCCVFVRAPTIERFATVYAKDTSESYCEHGTLTAKRVIVMKYKKICSFS